MHFCHVIHLQCVQKKHPIFSCVTSMSMKISDRIAEGVLNLKIFCVVVVLC